MKLQLASLDVVRQMVEEDDAGKWDYLCPVEALSYEVAPRSGQSLLSCLHGQFLMSPHAEGQLCQKLGIPQSYLRKCPTILKLQNVSYWLEKRKQKGGEVLLRTKHDVLRAFLSKSYSPFDNRDLLDVLAQVPALKDELFPHQPQVALTDKSFHLPLIKSEPIEVRLNGHKERFYLGVYLRNSEVGWMRVGLSACLHREVCGNVFVGADILAKIHIGIRRESIADQLSEFISNAVKLTSPKITAALLKALSVEVTASRRERLFAQAAKVAGKKALIALIRDGYEQEKEQSGMGDTLFTVAQALTRAAQHISDADARYSLSRYATQLLPLPDGRHQAPDTLWDVEVPEDD